MEKIYIETLGCSKNQVDSEKMAYLAINNGYKITDDPENAEYIIINTCSFIKSAKEEAIDTILEFCEYKTIGKCKKIIVSGCLAQYYSKILKEEMPEIDVIMGIGDLSKILEALNKQNEVIVPDLHPDKLVGRYLLSYPGSAYLKISDGCSNNCSYCLIPKIRGGLRSRDIEDIIQEVDFLKKSNIKEINIISQDSANFGVDLYNKKKLPELIKRIADQIDDDVWLRILYMHPDHLTPELLQQMKEVKNFIPYFDIPFQSGSERILSLMNRQGNRKKYLNLVDTIRKTFDDAVIRSTFITGFPGESKSDFKETIKFIEKAELEWVGGFTYSREEDTKAGNMNDQISELVKKERLETIYQVSDDITTKRLQRFIGSKQDILIEERVEGEDLFIGRFWGQAPEVDGLTVLDSENGKIGAFQQAEIKKLNDKDFYAVED